MVSGSDEERIVFDWTPRRVFVREFWGLELGCESSSESWFWIKSFAWRLQEEWREGQQYGREGGRGGRMEGD